MAQSKRFLQEIERLNPQQRQAVEAIEGPVMVVAGPGTGKTQVVALRIATILQRTQVGPKNILALTFTEAGVTALRTRLNDYIGSAAYQVTIATFHGFANEIIATFPHVFSGALQLRPLDDLSRYTIIEEIVRSNPDLRILRPLRSETAHVREIAARIRECKQEAISPEGLRTHGESQSASTGVSSKTERERAERIRQGLLELSSVYKQYQEILVRRGLYDYEDMILFVISALEENAEVKAYLQERYQYILVDEYQDTNNAQNRLVELLSDFFEVPNVFVVGDDKQAIYRFQGASVTNMLHFYDKYPAIQIFTLRQNYRSTPEILTSADVLISHNTGSLAAIIPAITATLVPARSSGRIPQLLSATTPTAEALEIIERLRAFAAQGVPWQEMAVVFRTNAEANTFRDMVERANIPVAGVQTQDLLQEKEIQALLSALRAIVQPRDEASAITYFRLCLAADEEILTLLDFIRQAREQKVPLVEVVLQNGTGALLEGARNLLDWSVRYPRYSLPELLETVLYQSGLLGKVRARNTSIHNLELLAAVTQNAHNFALREQNGTLNDWLSYLQLHQSYGVSFPINKNRAELQGVVITTVHQVKGLEFDVVFIPHATDSSWRLKPNRAVIRLPDELLGTQSQLDQLDDLRRLFYVAVTRARNELIFSTSSSDETGRLQVESQFIAEIEPTIERTPVVTDERRLEEFLSSLLSPIDTTILQNNQLAYIREQISAQPLSFTAYWDYKKCPRTFLLKHVYRFPTPFQPNLAYGEAVHRALELFGRAQRARKQLPARQELLDFFIEALQRGLPFSDRSNYLREGSSLLGAYYDKVLSTAPTPLEVEYNFRSHQVTTEGVPLTGKIDRIEVVDPVQRSVRVIDYKTGSQTRSRNYIEGKTKDSDGRIKTQLTFYALLSSLDTLFPYHATEFEVRFVDDAHKFTAEVFTFSANEVEALRRDVIATHQEMLTCSDFPLRDAESEIAQLFPELL